MKVFRMFIPLVSKLFFIGNLGPLKNIFLLEFSFMRLREFLGISLKLLFERIDLFLFLRNIFFGIIATVEFFSLEILSHHKLLLIIFKPLTIILVFKVIGLPKLLFLLRIHELIFSLVFLNILFIGIGFLILKLSSSLLYLIIFEHLIFIILTIGRLIKTTPLKITLFIECILCLIIFLVLLLIWIWIILFSFRNISSKVIISIRILLHCPRIGFI